MTNTVEKGDVARGLIAEMAEQEAHRRNITDDPDQPSWFLGTVRLADGRSVQAHIIHAADAVITDGEQTVCIARKDSPDKHALPGGFLDPVDEDGVEDVVTAAIREAREETGLDVEEGIPVGKRTFYRPHDVRVARNDIPQYNIKEGDVFTVSTQAVLFEVPDLQSRKLQAGDDAKDVQLVRNEDITRGAMSIKDHHQLARDAFAELAARKANPLHGLSEDGLQVVDEVRTATGQHQSASGTEASEGLPPRPQSDRYR